MIKTFDLPQNYNIDPDKLKRIEQIKKEFASYPKGGPRLALYFEARVLMKGGFTQKKIRIKG
jgi:hypothetical protein